MAKRKVTKKDQERVDALREAIENGLVEALPALEIVDRDLDLGSKRFVDLVGIDASRRLAFLLLTDGEGEECFLSAVDALLFGHENAALLGQHWGLDDVRTDVDPQIVLIADSFRPPALERLALLDGVDLRLFEVRELKSAEREHVYLVPHALAPASEAAPSLMGVGDFLDGLPDELRPRAEKLLRYIGRIDDRLQTSVSSDGVHWRYGNRVLCSVMALRGELEGSLPGTARPSTAIVGDEAVDTFLELVLGRHLELLHQERDGHEGDAKDEAAGPLVDKEVVDKEVVDSEDDRRSSELDRLTSGQLLTDEEIQAFRD
jgi:hypothetical protein